MKKLSIILLSVLFAAASCSCSSEPSFGEMSKPVNENTGGNDSSGDEDEPSGGQGGETPQEDDRPKATVWTTTSDLTQDFVKTTVYLGNPSTMSTKVVRFSSEKFQSVDGFGLAITQASCFNLLKMTKNERTRVLKEMFSRTEGAGSSLIRVCIGGSDFSMNEFTHCDTKGISNFKIHSSDVEYLFPILDEIYKINPDVQIIGSPWTCPKWMKMGVNGNGTHDSWTSGRLNPVYYEDYATYFVKWIQAFEGRGYKILAVTLQNEPLNHGNSSSLYMPWTDQRDFLNVVGPAFRAANIKAKILVFDHNYNYDNQQDQQQYPSKIFASTAGKYAAGSAWHNYGGWVGELDGIRSSNPDKEIYFTEASIGTWNYDGHGFWEQTREDLENIFFGTLSRYGKGVTLWNLMLDYNRKPYRQGGCSTCYGALNISPDSYSYSSIKRYSHWYDVAHFSAAALPGAERIGTTGYNNGNIVSMAFLNPDGSHGVVLLNKGGSDDNYVYVTENRSLNLKIPAKSVVSAIWKD